MNRYDKEEAAYAEQARRDRERAKQYDRGLVAPITAKEESRPIIPATVEVTKCPPGSADFSCTYGPPGTTSYGWARKTMAAKERVRKQQRRSKVCSTDS